MKSKLYQAVVLLGISWGGTAAGCLAESRRQSDGAPGDPDRAGSGGQDATGGRTGSGGATATGGSSGSTAGGVAEVGGASAGSSPSVAGSGNGAGASAGGSESGGAAGSASTLGGEAGGAEPVTAGSGGVAGSASNTGGIADAGTDVPIDAFCDETWPTTKGNPAAPPTCEDQAACGGPLVDASFMRWLECRARIGDHQCDYFHVTSICEDGAWVCPPDGMLIADCHCFGPTPAGMICTEDGFVPIDGGAAGAPG